MLATPFRSQGPSIDAFDDVLEVPLHDTFDDGLLHSVSPSSQPLESSIQVPLVLDLIGDDKASSFFRQTMISNRVHQLRVERLRRVFNQVTHRPYLVSSGKEPFQNADFLCTFPLFCAW
jgi:hypothetical protein